MKFLLSRKDIEDNLAAPLDRNAPAPPGTPVCDLHETRAWYKMRDYVSSKYNLVFGLYIDWFNPYTNKISG
jgi:hypothetical protein